MNTWEEFIRSIDQDQFRQIINDYEQLHRDTYIGDCALRRRAQQWHSILGLSESSILLTMQHLATESYKYFAHKYIDIVDK